MGRIPRSTSTTREPRKPISKASGSKKALPKATFGNAMGYVALLFLILGSGVFHSQPELEPQIVQFQRAESYLTQMIQEQVVQIEKVKLPGSKKLIENSKRKLVQLQNDYQELYQDWDENENQPLFINALILNLRTQLQLLEDIQGQFMLIQQKDYDQI